VALKSNACVQKKCLPEFSCTCPYLPPDLLNVPENPDLPDLPEVVLGSAARTPHPYALGVGMTGVKQIALNKYRPPEPICVITLGLGGGGGGCIMKRTLICCGRAPVLRYSFISIRLWCPRSAAFSICLYIYIYYINMTFLVQLSRADKRRYNK